MTAPQQHTSGPSTALKRPTLGRSPLHRASATTGTQDASTGTPARLASLTSLDSNTATATAQQPAHATLGAGATSLQRSASRGSTAPPSVSTAWVKARRRGWRLGRQRMCVCVGGTPTVFRDGQSRVVS